LRTRPGADLELLQVLDHTVEVARRAAEIVGGIRTFIWAEENTRQAVQINEVVRKVLDLLGTEARRWASPSRRIWAETGENRGAVFHVALPVPDA